MLRLRWTHRPTWPDRADVDRIVCVAEDVARIYRVSGGPMHGRWEWFYLAGGPDSSGFSETLDEALQAVRARHEKI